MCGDSTHLHNALVNDLQMTHFDIFGYLVPPKVAATNLGKNILLWGNINPMLMLNGTKEQVKQAAMECLEALAPCGGFMLGDGANVCPGTPFRTQRSRWFMLAACTRIRTSPGPGSGTGRPTISRTSGPPCSANTAAFISGMTHTCVIRGTPPGFSPANLAQYSPARGRVNGPTPYPEALRFRNFHPP